MENSPDEKNILDQTKFFGNSQLAFNAITMEKIINNEWREIAKKGIDGEHVKIKFFETKKYFLTYFAKSTNGAYYVYEPSEFENDNYGNIRIEEKIDNILNLFNENLEFKVKLDEKGSKMEKFNFKQWFLYEHKELFKANADPRASRFYESKKTGEKFVNLGKGFLHKDIKPFASYSDAVKKNVQKVIDHITNIWNSGNKNQSEFCLNFLAHALTGHKMNVALFLKSGEGTGKSLIVDFIIKHVIGDDLGISTSRAQQLMKFNSVLLGKIFLCLEELPTGNRNEWHSISDYLKDLITGSKIDIEKKYADAIQTINLMSLILLTNNENSIKFGKDIRRYMMCDVSHDKVGDNAYFDSIVKILTRETGEAFFMWLLERYESTTNFNPSECPMTEAKMEMKENNSTNILKFVKREYVASKIGLTDLQSKSKMIKLVDMKDKINKEYTMAMSTQKFHIALKQDIPIIKIFRHGTNKDLYIEPIDHKTLLDWFIKKGFWNETFDEFNKIKDEIKPNTDTDILVDFKDEKIRQLEEQIRELQQKLSKYEKVEIIPDIDVMEETDIKILGPEPTPEPDRPDNEVCVQPKKLLKVKKEKVKPKLQHNFKEEVKHNEEGDGILDEGFRIDF